MSNAEKPVGTDYVISNMDGIDGEIIVECQKSSSSRERLEIYSQIVKARKEQNLTQQELADKAGMQRSSIARLENGKQNPSLEILERVAKALGKELSVELK